MESEKGEVVNEQEINNEQRVYHIMHSFNIGLTEYVQTKHKEQYTVPTGIIGANICGYTADEHVSPTIQEKQTGKEPKVILKAALK